MFILPSSWIRVQKHRRYGRGVFAKQDIPGGTVLGDYLGKVYSDRTVLAFENKLGGALYSMYRNEKHSIWPDVTKPGVHLINHNCMPNTTFMPYQGHMLSFALRKIFAGEEVTTRYGVNPPENSKDLEPGYPCFCGTPLCRGTLYDALWLMNIHAKFYDRAYYKAQKTENLKAGDEIPPLAVYPETMPDCSDIDIFGAFPHRSHVCQDIQLPGKLELRQRIRETGCNLKFPHLGLTVHGVMYKHVLSEADH